MPHQSVIPAATPQPVLLIDNYDSFVFNLARYLQELGIPTEVCRNDAVSVGEVVALNPSAIVISPGPCTPQESGISLEIIRQLGQRIPLLGVCLGHQAIGQVFGGRVVRAAEPVHGRTSLVEHEGKGLFAGCPQPLRVGRYHSLIVDSETLPDALRVTARTADGMIMGLSHRHWPVHGVQFHPESVLTECGHLLLTNFLRLAGLLPAMVPAGDLPSGPDEDDFYRRPIDPAVFRPA